MPTLEAVTVFIGAALLLLVVPGPAVTYIVTRSLSQGTKAGLVSVLGLSAGTVLHIAAAAIGVSALLSTSPVAFYVLKLAGAAYLIWLGIQKLRQRENDTTGIRVVSARRVFADGIMVNLLNPKSALFFFAFLPQFADPERGSVSLQIVVFGAIFQLLAFVTDSTYALLAGQFAAALQRSSRRLGSYLAGGVYLGLGFAAAISGGSSK